MKEIKLIEEYIEGIRKRINNERLFEEKDEKYPVLEDFLEDINNLVKYIRNKEKWINMIKDMLCFIEEEIKTKSSQLTDINKKDQLNKLANKVYGMRKGIEREFLYDPDSLIERLKSDGTKIFNSNSSLSEAINGIGFKLLEKVRLGQRDEVLYLLLRTFKAHEQKLPESLIEALKTKYDDNLFKSFIYAFLAPILGKLQTQGGES